MSEAGQVHCLYCTRNTARSWRAVDLGVDAAIQCVAVSPEHMVVAGTEGDGLLWSHDAGTTWQVSLALAGRSVTAVAFLPSGTLLAATDAGIAVSNDDASTWDIVAPDVTAILTLLVADDDLPACWP